MLLQDERVSFAVPTGAAPTAITADSLEATTYALTSAGRLSAISHENSAVRPMPWPVSSVHQFCSRAILVWQVLWEMLVTPEGEAETVDWAFAARVPDLEAVCCASRSGLIVAVETHTQHAELVGRVESVRARLRACADRLGSLGYGPRSRRASWP